MAIVIQGENDALPKVIDAKISPPIFVDSRKSAREMQTTKQEVKVNSFYDLFPPEIFTKQLVKRKKTDKEQVSEEIHSDITGFTNYFTAPNIRNKVSQPATEQLITTFPPPQVKHPFFLAYKFAKCVKLYFNTELFK